LPRTFSCDAFALWIGSCLRKKHKHIQKWNDSEARDQKKTKSVATVAAKRKPRIPGGCAPAGTAASSSAVVVAPQWSGRGEARLARPVPPQLRRMEIMNLLFWLAIWMGGFWQGYSRECNAEIPQSSPPGKINEICRFKISLWKKGCAHGSHVAVLAVNAL